MSKVHQQRVAQVAAAQAKCDKLWYAAKQAEANGNAADAEWAEWDAADLEFRNLVCNQGGPVPIIRKSEDPEAHISALCTRNCYA
jgi:hypothetical protein